MVLKENQMFIQRLSVAAIALFAAAPAFAADLPNKKAPAPVPVVSPWEFTVGGGLTTNYEFRGISQSSNGPGVTALGEIRYNFSDTWAGYVGVSGESIKLNPYIPNPTMELDVDGGVRGTFGNLTTDVGAWYYGYPNAQFSSVLPTNPGWYEGYAKVAYNITDWLNVGGNAYFTPSYINTGASGTYTSGTFKVTLPANFSLSGELGRQFLGTEDLVHTNGGYPLTIRTGMKLPSYNTWNAGISYAYNFATLDLRYWGTDLSKSNCSLITGPSTSLAGTTSKYCGSAFVASLNFALTNKDLK
jgi:uncharacterized protein (TIGR02001 family)